MKGLPNQLESALTTAGLELDANADGHLAIRARRRIWDAMGPYRFDADEFALGAGHLRRSTLASISAGAALPIWEMLGGDSEPEEVLQLVDSYLAGHVVADPVWSAAERLFDRADHLEDGPEAWVVLATYHAVNVAFGDELIPTDGAQAEELDMSRYDSAYYAACAISGSHPGEAGGSAPRRRMFWTWYLESAVPAAYTVALDRAAH